ncbi:hypothetical protein NE237_015407 [Protea cynaroides]|uniref:Uncharacterized protein n=1 Tax=Protea cynaroides TaxID=273540 RepID=A0A9Q0KE75_9MAGN|nr:hypothetical protein NE237_015407 [Protea cynaroides]
MAWTLCSFTNFSHYSAHKSVTITRKTLVSVSLHSPSKRAKRKNHLRPKILKTLRKSYSIPLLHEVTLENYSVEILRDQQLEFHNERFFEEVSEDLIRRVEEENVELELESRGFCAPETAEAGVSNAIGVVTSRSVLQLAFYFVGFFIFQTVCAVWVLGSSDMSRETGNVVAEAESTVSELEMWNRKINDFLLRKNGQIFQKNVGSKPGNVTYEDKSQLEDKIVEIRTMAREARECEARKLRANDVDPIRQDVNESLEKLKKRREKLPMASISYLSGLLKVQDRKNSESSEVKEKAGKLLFKKKHRFRSSLTGSENKTKGFNGSKQYSLPNDNNRGSAIGEQSLIGGNNFNNDLDLSGQEKQLDLSQSDSWKTMSAKMEKELHCLTDETSGENVPEVLEMEKRRKETSINELGYSDSVGKKSQREGVSTRRELWNVENSGAGGVQETNCTKHFAGLAEPRELTELKTQASQSLTKENQNISEVPYILASLSGNGSSIVPSETRETECNVMVNNFRDRQLEIENDFWWLKLPYALGILLHRGSDREGQRGLYSLKISSDPQDRSCSSYTIAFEDRTDATNFSYLLESFFEDLGDCSANIVALPIKELIEAVKSNVRKVIVVRKGQVQLYAGQPLGEVEMALRSLIQ